MMMSEEKRAEKHFGPNEHHATDVSDESEDTTAAPSVTAAEDPQISPSTPRGFQAKATEASKSLAAMPSSEMPTPPNGGLAAWLQVLGGFFVYFNTWSVDNVFECIIVST